MNTINILTYNIHKGFNLANTQYTLDLIKKEIQKSNAELVCLQEVCGRTDHFKQTDKYLSESQFEYLADGIWPHFAYGKNAVYKKGHHGNVILSKYPITNSHNLNISNHRFEKRGLLHAKIEYAKNSFFHVMSAHLDLTEGGRKKQSNKIIKYIRNSIGIDDKLILAGDLNDWRQNLSNIFLKELNLKEVFVELHGEHAKSFPSFSPLLRLDRIYFRNLTPIKAQTFFSAEWNKLSDHTPLFAEFNI